MLKPLTELVVLLATGTDQNPKGSSLFIVTGSGIRLSFVPWRYDREKYIPHGIYLWRIHGDDGVRWVGNRGRWDARSFRCDEWLVKIIMWVTSRRGPRESLIVVLPPPVEHTQRINHVATIIVLLRRRR